MLSGFIRKSNAMRCCILVAPAMLSCADSTADQPSESVVVVAKRLPSFSTGGDCPSTEQGSTDPLIWAHSFDAIVVGDVTSVAPLVEPAWLSSSVAEPTFVNADACVGSIAIGIVVRLTNVEYLVGTGPSEVELVFGNRLVEQWDPAPVLRGTEVIWPGASSGAPAVSVGQRLGSPVFLDPVFNRYSPARSPAFVVDSDLVVRFQTGFAGCSVAPPHLAFDNLPLRTVQTMLGAAIGAQQAESASQLRDARRSWPDAIRLANWFSALCIELHPAGGSPDGCVSDVECEQGSTCINWICGTR